MKLWTMSCTQTCRAHAECFKGRRVRSQCIPLVGPVSATAQVRVLEAYVSAHFSNHEFSFGKQDNWIRPGLGGGMAYSNNAETSGLSGSTVSSRYTFPDFLA